MRMLMIATATLLCAACGQKGPLVLPQKSVATPVVIRSTETPVPPAATPPAATPPAATSPGAPPPAPKKDDESKTPPQG
jgi:predicted small lipoprotein YifL